MDPAANVAAGANTCAPDDAMDVERKRAADWPHWPDRGNGGARRDRLERRLFRDSEREAELARAQEAIRRIEEATAAKAADVEGLEQAVEATADPEADCEPATLGDYLVFAWAPQGYALHGAQGEPPPVGSRVSMNGHEFAVAKLARSPLPGDERRCAYLEPQ